MDAVNPNNLLPTANLAAAHELSLGASCKFCGTPLKHMMADLGMQPLANAYRRPADLDKMEPFFPLRALVCGNCLLVQAQEFETAENIFTADYAYFSSYAESWLDHARTYVEDMTERFKLTPANQVVEIACNDGYLLRWFLPKKIKVLGIEPTAGTAHAAAELGVPVQIRFFGRKTAEDLKQAGYAADLMPANNVVAHVPDINDFIAGFKILLTPTGVATFEFQHVLNVIRNMQFDTIYHEHYYYHSLSTFKKILAHHGLSVFDAEELPTHGGSLRVYAQHTDTGPHATAPRVAEMLEQERKFGLTDLKVYLDYGEKIKKVKRDILTFLIKAKEEGKTIAACGAPAKGNTLLNYAGIRTDFIEYTVDRTPQKQGCYLPGTHIPIMPPEYIYETKPDYVVILPWNWRDEFMSQMSQIRTWGGKFVVLIPHIEVL